MKPAAPRARPSRKLPAWLARAQRLLFQPTQEWATIAAEFATPGPIYTRFLLPMAAIGPLAATVGTIVFGVRSSFAGTYEMSIGDAVTSGVLEYGLNLGGVYALALIIDLLAPMLGTQGNRVQALKVAAYATTPYWLGGVLALFPKLTPIGMLLGLYSIWLFKLGLVPVMKIPRDRSAAATLLVTIGGVLVALLIGALSRVFV
ncbi:MAG TPA: Yip1 family protein [Gemmatimonadales bacterium]|nr:Yip1 family protein [Gemmatimonadales bacterium]